MSLPRTQDVSRVLAVLPAKNRIDRDSHKQVTIEGREHRVVAEYPTHVVCVETSDEGYPVVSNWFRSPKDPSALEGLTPERLAPIMAAGGVDRVEGLVVVEKVQAL